MNNVTRFVDNADGTVTDLRTGLMWSKGTLTDGEVNHATAEKICADLDLAGHRDWRLPTVDELFALAVARIVGGLGAFPDTQSDWYWTSTIAGWSSGYYWLVAFNDGYASLDLLRDNRLAFVRAVRSIQQETSHEAE